MIDYATVNRSAIADKRFADPNLAPNPWMPWIEKLSQFGTMGV
jgi:hypothetical protein